MSEETHKFGDSELGQALAIAAIILAVTLGIGGCELMEHYARSPDKPAATESQRESEKP